MKKSYKEMSSHPFSLKAERASLARDECKQVWDFFAHFKDSYFFEHLLLRSRTDKNMSL